MYISSGIQTMYDGFHIRMHSNKNGRPREGIIINSVLVYVHLNNVNAFKDFYIYRVVLI